MGRSRHDRGYIDAGSIIAAIVLIAALCVVVGWIGHVAFSRWPWPTTGVIVVVVALASAYAAGRSRG